MTQSTPSMTQYRATAPVPDGTPVSTPAPDGSRPTSHGTATDITVTIRYFAAARAASGVDDERVAVPPGTTLSAVLETAGHRHGEGLARVLTRCSYLRNAVAVHDVATELTDGDEVDVLPPFAGG